MQLSAYSSQLKIEDHIYSKHPNSSMDSNIMAVKSDTELPEIFNDRFKNADQRKLVNPGLRHAVTLGHEQMSAEKSILNESVEVPRPKLNQSMSPACMHSITFKPKVVKSSMSQQRMALIVRVYCINRLGREFKCSNQ